MTVFAEGSEQIGRVARIVLPCIVVGVWWALVSPMANAKTYEVTRQDDPAPDTCREHNCSLREAVRAANARPGADRIVLPLRRNSYRISLASTMEDDALNGDLDVTGDLMIVHPGPGSAKVAVDRVERHFVDRQFEVLGGSLTLKRLRLYGGEPRAVDDFGDGGAIRTTRPIELIKSEITGSMAHRFGGAISAEGSAARVTILHSVIGAEGRFLGIRAGLRGGAVDMDGAGALRIDTTTIQDSGAEGNGGAIYLDSAEPALISRTTFHDNISARGGALYVELGADAGLVNSTLNENSANFRAGGGVPNGAGIYNSGAISMNAATLVHNRVYTEGAEHGGNIYNAGTARVRNSLWVSFGPHDANCDGPQPIESLGHNSITDGGGTPTCTGFDRASDLYSSNPLIGRLDDNGGPTPTIRLKKGSPAIGHASRKTSPTQDQRGAGRDRHPDIGAFEKVRFR